MPHAVGHSGPCSGALALAAGWSQPVLPEALLQGPGQLPLCALPASQPAPLHPESSLDCPPGKDAEKPGGQWAEQMSRC